MRAAVVDRWRFDRKVLWSPTCLWWVGAIGDDGYGRFAAGTGRVMSAHRWLWEQDVGPLRLTAAITAGEPWRQQLALFPDPDTS